MGALFIAFSATYWTNAIEAEVYAMSCFLMGVMTWLALKWGDDPAGPKSTTLIYLMFYLLAMSVGFHLGTILAFSGIFFFVWLTSKKRFANLEFLVACAGIGIFVADATLYRSGQTTLVMLAVFVCLVAWLYVKRSRFAAVCTGLFMLGLSVHLYLLIRSHLNPAIDMGDPENLKSLYAVLRREQYPSINLLTRKASMMFQFQHFNSYFQNQFEMFTAFLGKLSVGALVPLGLGIWGMVDHFSRNKKSFILLFVTFIITSLGLILFLNFSDSESRDRDYFYSPAFFYFTVFIGIGAGSILRELRRALANQRKLAVPALFAAGCLLLLLPMLTARHHFFSHDRSNNYTCREFSINMLKPLKPNAIIFTNGDNDSYPLWYIQQVENYRTDVRVVVLPLLNTPWYVKQMRDNKPQLPIAWTDEQVDSLRPVPTRGGWLSIKDLALRHIIRENNWQRPIYFAVTIPKETFAPFKDYLEMQGLVYELIPQKGENMINVAMLEDTIYNQFSYRSILTSDWKKDESVYLALHTRYLIQNYASAFIQLGFHQKDDPAKGLRALQIANEISPQKEPVKQLLGRFYFMAGDTQEALRHYDEMLRREPDNPGLLYRAAEIYELIGDYERAIQTLDKLLSHNPEDRQATLIVYGVSVRANLLSRARRYLVRWLSAHPDDQEVRTMLQRFDGAVEVVPKRDSG